MSKSTIPQNEKGARLVNRPPIGGSGIIERAQAEIEQGYPDPSHLLPPLIAELQATHARIAELEAKIAATLDWADATGHRQELAFILTSFEAGQYTHRNTSCL